MIFTSFEFVAFFVAVMVIRRYLRSFTVEKSFLLVASYVFYMSWNVPAALLILSTSLLDFYLARRLGQIDAPQSRKRLLIVSLTANLGVLAFFKYTNFLLDTGVFGLNLLGMHVNSVHYKILLPVGISFFTFQSMSYTIDVYRRHLPPCASARDFLLYVAFFPQLAAGPIVRAADFLPQLKQRLRPSALDIETGLVQFAVGAIKKLVIADQISPHVDLIFATPANYDGLTLLQGIIGYAIQIYCDFSGYSDMAIGSARMMGFRFPENFQMPYSAVTITEFWRRWHMSLSSWLRDYVYIPLGGNRNGTMRTYVNLMLTMVLGGLWHGASWNFVFWGGLHGVSLAIHKVWTSWNPLAPLQGRPEFRAVWQLFSRVLTLSVVLLGWIFFRADSWSAATQYVSRLMTWSHDGTRLVSPYILAAIAAVSLAHLVVPKDRLWVREIPAGALSVRVLVYSSLALLLACLAATDTAPFIYFQF